MDNRTKQKFIKALSNTVECAVAFAKSIKEQSKFDKFCLDNLQELEEDEDVKKLMDKVNSYMKLFT